MKGKNKHLIKRISAIFILTSLLVTSFVPLSYVKAEDGNDDDNVIIGDDTGETIDAQGGDDEVYGNGGDDVISGGEGDDILDGGEGDDILNGEEGDDTLTGGPGEDELDGGEGEDEIAEKLVEGSTSTSTSEDAPDESEMPSDREVCTKTNLLGQCVEYSVIEVNPTSSTEEEEYSNTTTTTTETDMILTDTSLTVTTEEKVETSSVETEETDYEEVVVEKKKLECVDWVLSGVFLIVGKQAGFPTAPTKSSIRTLP